MIPADRRNLGRRRRNFGRCPESPLPPLAFAQRDPAARGLMREEYGTTVWRVGSIETERDGHSAVPRKHHAEPRSQLRRDLESAPQQLKAMRDKGTLRGRKETFSLKLKLLGDLRPPGGGRTISFQVSRSF